MSFSPAVRRLIEQRSGGICEVCHRWRAEQMHHRCARGMGGSKAPWIDQASNGLHVCGTNASGCHGAATETNVEWCRRCGIVIPYGLAEQKGGCAQIPFRDWNEVLWQLDNQGGKTPLTPGEERSWLESQ